MTAKFISEIFQQISQQVDSARESLQKIFDDEFGSVLNENVKEKAELQSKLEKTVGEKKEIEHELIELKNLSSKYFLKVEKELTEPISSDRIYYGIPNLEKKIDEAIFDATNYFNKNCPYCGNSLYQGHVRRKIEIDHFIPISRGGQNFPWNLLPICKDCNRKKRDKLPSEFLEKKIFENCFNYLNDVKKRFSADIDCIGNFKIIRNIIYDNIGSLNDKNKVFSILQQIAVLVHPGIQSVQDEPLSDISSNERKCLTLILEAEVKLSNSHPERKIVELIKTMAKMPVIDETDYAQITLKKHGVRVVQDGFLIANKHSELTRILEGTPWASNWSSTLGRLSGATRPGPTLFNDVLSRVVKVPFSYIH